MEKMVTLFESPPLDPSKAPIENVLELTPVLDIGPVSPYVSTEIIPHLFPAS